MVLSTPEGRRPCCRRVVQRDAHDEFGVFGLDGQRLFGDFDSDNPAAVPHGYDPDRPDIQTVVIIQSDLAVAIPIPPVENHSRRSSTANPTDPKRSEPHGR